MPEPIEAAVGAPRWHVDARAHAPVGREAAAAVGSVGKQEGRGEGRRPVASEQQRGAYHRDG